MKKISAAALVAFILCFSAVRTGAAERLTVTGHGGISVPADTVTVSFSVDVRAASLADSQKKSDEVGKKTVLAAKKYGSVYEESYFSYEDAACGKWCVSRSYIVTSSRPEDADEICAALTSSGATAICFIGFSLSDTSEYEGKALDAAIKDARARASSLGNTLGEREIIDFGSCVCICCENSDRRGYVTVECTVNILYY